MVKKPRVEYAPRDGGLNGDRKCLLDVAGERDGENKKIAGFVIGCCY